MMNLGGKQMNYRNNNGQKDLSILGYGCMRFPKKAGSIDMIETEKQVMYAIENGVNYFDTAYIYPGSEAALGEILYKNNVREKVKIATKLPHYLVKKTEDLEKYFQEELKRLQTDYVDYYLMHMLPDVQVWKRLIGLGVLEWIEEKKSLGQIKYIGFSYHGNTQNFLEVLNVYDWEFCQIQYNYMDEHSQAGVKGLKAAAEKNIPVIIMEPLRGGLLVNGLPKKAEKAFEESTRHITPVEWALRWLWRQEEVSVILSGMSTMAMIEENINIASNVEVNEWSSSEEAFISEIRVILNEKTKVPCTACSYCMPCPFGVDIPGAFRCYNVSHVDGYFVGLKEYAMSTTLRSKQTMASLCTACGACEKHCPQNIKIIKELKKVKRRFESPVYKLASKYIKKRYS